MDQMKGWQALLLVILTALLAPIYHTIREVWILKVAVSKNEASISVLQTAQRANIADVVSLKVALASLPTREEMYAVFHGIRDEIRAAKIRGSE